MFGSKSEAMPAGDWFTCRIVPCITLHWTTKIPFKSLRSPIARCCCST